MGSHDSPKVMEEIHCHQLQPNGSLVPHILLRWRRLVIEGKVGGNHGAMRADVEIARHPAGHITPIASSCEVCYFGKIQEKTLETSLRHL